MKCEHEPRKVLLIRMGVQVKSNDAMRQLTSYVLTSPDSALHGTLGS